MSTPTTFRKRQRRALLVHLAVGCGITGAVCALAILIGFRLNVVFFVLLAAVVAVAIWLVRYVVRPAREVADQAPVLDVLHLQSRNGDPRVRKLEEFLYGSQPRFNLATPQLRKVIAELVADRVAAGADADSLSPELRDYLEADPARAVDRRRIRMMIKEITAL